MKNINESIGDIILNVSGDKLRSALGSIPGLNIPVGVVSFVMNLDELDEDYKRYEKLKDRFEEGKNMENLLEEFDKVEDDLKIDFIDTLQVMAETGIPGFKFLKMFGAPLMTSLAMEELLLSVSKIIPFGDDVKIPMMKYLGAIKHISQMKRELKQYENPKSIVDKILPPLTEGKKKTGTKLCSRGKSAAKSKFDVYPSAYANGYAIQVCKGKIKGLDGKKRCSPPYC